MPDCPIANLLLGRKGRPSFPFGVHFFLEQVLSGAFPKESIWVIGMARVTGRNGKETTAYQVDMSYSKPRLSACIA